MQVPDMKSGEPPRTKIRRPHSKSRRGCVLCKARKIKVANASSMIFTKVANIIQCDEVRPQCIRCAYRGDKCHFVDNFSNKHSKLSAPSSPLPAFGNHDTEASFKFFKNALPSTPERLSTSEQGTGQTFRDRDLELFHHYSTSTCHTLATVKSVEKLWQIDIPKLAFSNDFLMHGILATSACHLAHLRPEATDHYINIARYHYTSAISVYRPLLNHVSEENCASIMAFSTVVACLAIAMPQISSHEPDPPSSAMAFVTNMFELLSLIRGVKMIVACTWPWIQNTTVAPLLEIDIEMFSDPLPFEAAEAVRSMEERIRAEAECELREDYLDAMKIFVKCYPRGSVGNMLQGIVLAWPAMVSDRFFTVMTERRPIPLAILGMWGKVLGMLHDVWWVGNKGQRLVAAVSELLPPAWESTMRWAKIRVNLQDTLDRSHSQSKEVELTLP